MTMLAFVNTTVTKPAILKQLKAHAKADQFVKGMYWDYVKGCAIGCTIHSGNHVEYEKRFGIPQMLAHLEDHVFEGLPNDLAKKWPVQFMSAVQPGADLSRVGWQFLHWLLTDDQVNPGINHPLVSDAIKKCAAVLEAKGLNSGAASAARSAAWSAESAASAAWSAASAASAAWSAASAASAAESAAESAARSAAYILMAHKLIELIKVAPRGTP
jgi:hypothetical protein